MRIRLATLKDEEFLRDIRNNNRQYFFDSSFINKKDHHKWFLKELTKKDCKIFIIEYKKVCIGTFSLLNIEYIQAEFGRFIIDKQYRRLNYGTKAMNKLKWFCRIWCITHLYLYIQPFNFKAMRFYIKQGFKIKSIDNKRLRMDYA